MSVSMHVVLATLEGCASAFLDDPKALEGVARAASEAGEFTVLNVHVHQFEPQGVTATAVLAESHLHIHTWPEDRRLFVDIASCTSREAAQAALSALIARVPHTCVTEQEVRVCGAGEPKGE